MSIRVFLLGLVCLTACSAAEGERAALPEVDPADLKAHMQGHLVDVTTLRDAVAMGEPGAARGAVSAFLDHPVARDLPGDWLPRVAAMGEAAIGVRDAPTVGGMADNAGSLAAECGACHEAVLAEVRLPAAEPGTDHASRATWVLDQLWAGLIEPDDERFDAATADLSLVAPDGADATATRRPRRALEAGASRPRVAGAVLSACADCHAPELLPDEGPARGQVGSRPSLR